MTDSGIFGLPIPEDRESDVQKMRKAGKSGGIESPFSESMTKDVSKVSESITKDVPKVVTNIRKKQKDALWIFSDLDSDTASRKRR